MTDQAFLSPPDETPRPTPNALSPKPQSRDIVPILGGLGFLILAVAIFCVWQYPAAPGETDANRMVERRLADIDARLTHIEQQPIADAAKIDARMDALAAKVSDQTQMGSRLDTLSGRIEALSGRNQAGLDAARQQLDAMTVRLAAIEANAGTIDAVTKRLNQVARLQEASFALASGQPIGDLSGAPAALTRFAHAPPPTETQLRLRFQRDEQAALATKQPENGQGPFIDRVWDRAQALVTIHRGDELVLGNPTAMALSQADAALGNGDLAAAVTAVEGLKGQPAQVMANWLADARALLNARSALTSMAGHA